MLNTNKQYPFRTIIKQQSERVCKKSLVKRSLNLNTPDLFQYMLSININDHDGKFCFRAFFKHAIPMIFAEGQIILFEYSM